MPTPFEAGKTANTADEKLKEMDDAMTRDFCSRSGYCVYHNSTHHKTPDELCADTLSAGYALHYVNEPYRPRVGDRVSLEGEVVSVYETDKTRFDLLLDFKTPLRITIIPVEDACKLKLLSRKTR